MDTLATLEADHEPMLSLPEAAAMLRCHPNTIRAWVRQGKLVPVPMGPDKVNLFRKADVERLKKPLERAGVIVKDDHHAFPVVGIGASAGGLDAITRLLDHLPTDLGLAYVFVTHQKKDQENTLAQVLRNKTAMPVIVVENGMKLDPDRLYVAPSDMHTAVVNSTFTLQQPRSANDTRVRPIDTFFTALASEFQNNSIGILLSGGGTDGTEGLRAIKAEDGLTIVQDASAHDSGMPASAQEAEVVDLVRAPEEIARELVHLVKELFPGGKARIPSKHENDLRRILQFLLDQRGIDFTEYKEATIHRRIIRRMVLSKCRKLADYSTLLRGTPSEVDTLCNDLLINVTSFFRDPAFHKALTERVFPDLFADRTSTDALRIWVPACAGGEEVVSIAITLLEFLGERALNTPVQIFATDLNERSIERARLGIYKKSALQNMDPARLAKYFIQVDGHYQVIKPIRDLCVYAKHDLLKDPPFSRVDLISCQNALIYLENNAQARVLKSFHYALKPTGYLALGKSEATSTADGFFMQPDRDFKVFRKKSKRNDRLSKDFPLTSISQPSALAVQRQPSLRPMSTDPDIDRAMEQVLLHRYVPPSVLVNKDLEIVRFMGSTAHFLTPRTGRASLNLLKMVRDELAFELRALLHKARKEKVGVRKSGIPMQLNAGTYEVAVEVVPIGDARHPHYLVLFKEESKASSPIPENGSIAGSKKDARDRRLAALEQELWEARELVRQVSEEAEITTQELQAANEEVVSSNEELQSVNEEMETSKEELQSINEEYATINEELRRRNEALQESEERLRLAIRAGNLGIWDWDLVSDHMTWSASLYEIHGVDKEHFEPTVASVARLVHGDDRERVDSVATAAIKRDAKYETEFRAIRPDGEQKWLFTTAIVIRANNIPIRVLGVTMDITSRKVAEIALQRRTRSLELMNAMGDTLIAELDTEKIVQAVTDTGREVSGAAFGAFFYNVTNDDGKSYMLYTLSGLPREAFAKFPMPRATDLFGPTFKGEGVVRIDDVRKDPRYGKMAPHHGLPAGHPKVSSYLAAPVTSRDGKVIGGLFFGHPEPGHFNQEAEDLVVTLAAQAALAVDNANLHAAVQRELDQQQQARLALQISEERFRLLADNMDQLAWMAEADGSTVWFNDRWEQFSGIPTSEIAARAPTDLHHPDHYHRVITSLTASAEKGESWEDTFPLKAKDGTWHWFLSRALPVKDAEGRVTRWFGTSTDITERKAAEEAVADSEKRYRQLIDTLPAAVFTCDQHGKILLYNEACKELWGQVPDPNEHVWNAAFALFTKDGTPIPPEMSPMAVAVREGRSVREEIIVERPDGSRRNVLVHPEPLFDGTGQVTGAYNVLVDITERQIAEADRQQLSSMLERSVNEIYIFDLSSLKFEYVNHGALSNLGYTLEQMRDMTPLDIKPEFDAGQFDALVEPLRRGEKDKLLFHTVHRRADGTNYPVEVHLQVVSNGTRRVFMAMILDITERKLDEERLRVVTETGKLGIWDWDIVADTITWTDPVYEIHGVVKGAFEPSLAGYAKLIHPEDRERVTAAINATLQEDAPYEMEFRTMNDQGVINWVYTSGVVIRDAGRPVRMMGGTMNITRRKEAEEEARRLAAIVESSEDAILSEDLNGIITTWNRGSEQLYGYLASECLGRSILFLIPEGREQEERNLLSKVVKGARVAHYETQRRHKDGALVDVALSLSPIKDEAGNIIGASKIARDISQRKKAELALRESEERFHLLADNIGQLAWIAEPDGEIHWYNKRWFDYSGTTLEEMRGWGWQKVHHPDHVDRVTEKFRAHIRSEKDWEDTFPIRGADGEYRWFLSRAFPVRDEHGKVLRWFGTNTDVTAERMAREMAMQSEERFRLLADHMSQMAYTADGQGRITWVNRRWIDFTGMSVEEMNDGGWGRVVDPMHFDAMVSSYAKAQQQGATWEHVFRLRNTQGEYRWFLSRSVPIHDEQGEVQRWFGTNTDITEQKMAEEALEESARHKDHFLATLAHELRNPLAPLKNGLQLMELAPDDPQMLETTRTMMVRQLDHMVRLVDDLMDLSRISRGKIDLVKTDIELRSVVATALEASKPLIERQKHQLNVELTADMLMVHGDADRLTQVVSNLLNNAAKYTPPGGRIDLWVGAQQDEAVIRVKDNGIGIDEAAMPKVFDMFAQVDPNQKTEAGGGLGIGLNVVQRLVRMHRGEVEGHSEGLGKGSEFIVRLPLINAVEKPVTAQQSVPEPIASRRVLVVDDNEDIALSMSLLLKRTGHVVAVAHDGAQAVALAGSFRPEVILMDIGMPRMNGYEACSAIRATDHGKHMHIIAVSGWGQEEDRKKSHEAGFDGHVVKPMEKTTMARVIAEAKRHGE